MLNPRIPPSRAAADFDGEDLAWMELLGALEDEAPPAGFGSRVMARWSEESAAQNLFTRKGLFSGLLPRFALAASLLGGGLAVAASLAVAPVAWEWVRAIDPLATLATLLAWIGEGLARGVARGASTWSAWSTVSNTAGHLFSRPQVVAALAIAWLVAAGALSALNRLLSSDRSLSHV